MDLNYPVLSRSRMLMRVDNTQTPLYVEHYYAFASASCSIDCKQYSRIPVVFIVEISMLFAILSKLVGD